MGSTVQHFQDGSIGAIGDNLESGERRWTAVGLADLRICDGAPVGFCSLDAGRMLRDDGATGLGLGCTALMHRQVLVSRGNLPSANRLSLECGVEKGSS
jgi:hypothetical protein